MGAALQLLVFGVLVFLGLDQLPTPQPGELDILGVSLRTIIGVGFLIAAIWLIRSHPSLEERSAQFMQDKAQHASTRDFFFLGLALNGKSLTSYALLLPALHDIATFKQGVEWQILALVVLYTLALSTLWIPVVLAIVVGRRGSSALVTLSNFVLRHNFTILGVMFLLVGIYLTGSAAVLVALFNRL